MPTTEMIKAAVLGVVEGLTEWLPVSSTGHMLIADELLRLDVDERFRELFLVAIQLGAVLAVLSMYIEKLTPVKLCGGFAFRRDVLALWGKILAACVPAGIIGTLFDETITDLFFNYQTVAATLVFYGAVFIVLERSRVNKRPEIESLDRLDYKTALYIGAFQVLSLIPGTSRSGATILGAMLMGASRTIAAEFSFFLAIPVMLGASFLKLIKLGSALTGAQAVILLSGMATALVVSLLTIRFLLSHLRRHGFTAFGWYRIALGIAVMLFFTLR